MAIAIALLNSCAVGVILGKLKVYRKGPLLNFPDKIISNDRTNGSSFIKPKFGRIMPPTILPSCAMKRTYASEESNRSIATKRSTLSSLPNAWFASLVCFKPLSIMRSEILLLSNILTDGRRRLISCCTTAWSSLGREVVGVSYCDGINFLCFNYRRNRKDNFLLFHCGRNVRRTTANNKCHCGANYDGTKKGFH